MHAYPSDIAFTPAVKSMQAKKGSRESYAKMETRRGWNTSITDDLRGFLKQLDMFYLGTANANGQPYIQYRGGPTGFLRVLDEKTLAFADFGGNQQYISVGNLSENPQAFLFLMDYVHRRRIKIWGRAKVIEGDEDLKASLHDPSYSANVERAIVFEVEAWDVNCPQHIHRRLPANEVATIVEGLKQKIQVLEAQLEEGATDAAPSDS